jgi:tetratricopeptide (TPR) repeat protein
MSFDIDDTNPLTMKHLADHFFLVDDLDISEELCRRALKFCEALKKPDNVESPYFRKDIYNLKSDLYFILGKIYHKKEDYEKAYTHYFQTIKLNP